MKRFWLTAPLAMLLLVTTVVAEEEIAAEAPPQDVIGIYFDGDAQVDCVSLAPGEHFAYLMVTDLSVKSGILGWEGVIEIEGEESCLVLDWGLQGEHFNIASAPTFFVGLSEPIYRQPVVLLAELNLLVLDEGPVYFRIRPTEFPAIAGHPCYSASHDPNLLVPLNIASGSPDKPVASINADCKEDSPWR